MLDISKGRVEVSQGTALESLYFLSPVVFACLSYYLLLLSEAGSYSKFCTVVTATGAEILVMEMETWKEAQKTEGGKEQKQWDFLVTLSFRGPSCWLLQEH